MNVDPFDENVLETSARPFVTKVEMRNSVPSTSATIESRSGRVTCDGEQEVMEPWLRAWKKKPLLLVCENVSSTNPSNFKGLGEVFGEF